MLKLLTNINKAQAITVIAVIWSVFQLIFSSVGILNALTLRAALVLFLVMLVFLLYPTFNSNKLKTKSYIFDAIFIGLGIFSFAYFIINYPIIVSRGSYFNTIDIVVASIGIFICFEMARRVIPSMAVLALIFFLYNFFGEYLGGVFAHSALSYTRVIEHMFWGSQGIFGVGVGLASTYLFSFIIFGVFLKNSGFSDFITDLALALVGRTTGGPAKVAVLASAFMGMINGSAVANVATTGLITIPMMKKAGYKSEFAAAVEAAASTGGQFAPPIMGAVAFLMAEFLNVPYVKVMFAAMIPAFLYYLALMFAVHFEAKKIGAGLALANIPQTLAIIKQKIHLIVPIIVLLVLLFMGYTPLFSSVFAILSTILAASLRKSTRMSLQTIILSLEESAIQALPICVSCVIIGIIIGTVSLTGLGINFGYATLSLVGDNQMYTAAILVMIMSMILGLGVPGIAAYVIIATVSVPVLIKAGATPMAAHLFCIYYACLSNITPPVAMSSYVAAGIAKANQLGTSLIAMRIALVGFILPFFFLENNYLLYSSSNPISLTLFAFFSASIGVIALSAALEGYLIKPCNIVLRFLLFFITFLAIHSNIYYSTFAIIIFGLIILYQKRGSKCAN